MWYPEKLRRQLAYGSDPEVGLVHCLPDHRDDDIPPLLKFEQLWQRNWIQNSSVLIRRRAFEALGGFNEARDLISVEDYNLWIRVAASDWKIVTCRQVLFHYTRGIGISSNSERFMRASLFNVDDIGARLSLPQPMLARGSATKLSSISAERHCSSVTSTNARRLLGRAFRQEPNARNLAHVIVASMPASVLDVRRGALRLLERRDTAAKFPPSGRRRDGDWIG